MISRVAIDIRTASAVNQNELTKIILWLLKLRDPESQIIPDIEVQPIAVSGIRFVRSPVFGQLKFFRFFDLSASRSQSPIIWLGIGSVSVTAKWGHRESVWILRLSKAKTEGAWDSESPGVSHGGRPRVDRRPPQT